MNLFYIFKKKKVGGADLNLFRCNEKHFCLFFIYFISFRFYIFKKVGGGLIWIYLHVIKKKNYFISFRFYIFKKVGGGPIWIYLHVIKKKKKIILLVLDFISLKSGGGGRSEFI